MKIKRYQLVELTIPAGLAGNLNNVYFQQQPQLQTVMNDKTVMVDAIETFTSDTFAVSPFIAGQAVATAAALVNASLNLSMRNDYRMLNIPLVSLNRGQAPGTFTPFVYDWFELAKTNQVDWTKSYVTLSAAPVGAPFSYLFGVVYHFDNDEL